MATTTWSSFCSHTNDATFRVWGKKISDELQLMTEVALTADTGQINWATVTRPGVSTNAGYEIYKMNDTQVTTAPIWFRLDYGTAGAATTPRMQLTVGTGSDGAGTITGPSTCTTMVAKNLGTTAPTSAVTNYTSYLCVDEGFIGLLAWGSSTNTSTCAQQGFIIARTNDTNSTAAHNGDGVVVVPCQQNAQAMYINIKTGASLATSFVGAQSATADAVSIPHAETATLIGGNAQLYPCFHGCGYAQPMATIGAYLKSEKTKYNTEAITPVGTTSRTIMYVGQDVAAGTVRNAATPNNWGLWMLWQ
jgi:hypothetical protein